VEDSLSFKIGDKVEVYSNSQNGIVLEIHEDMLGLKVEDSESLLWILMDQVKKRTGETDQNSDSIPLEAVEIIRLPGRDEQSVCSGDEIVRYVAELTTTKQHMSQQIANLREEIRNIDGFILKIEEDIKYMQEKIKMDESEIDFLKRESARQTSSLRQNEPELKNISSIRGNVEELKIKVISRAERLSEVQEYTKVLEKRREKIKAHNDECWYLADSSING